jgi:Na+/H+ antiporter NhaD/arsenite permease-like protein/mannitol/fructose-specific phosphotransferase system IIA component (Ntr-type)
MIDLTRLIPPEHALDAPPVASQRELFDYAALELARRGLVDDPAGLAAELMRREELGSTGVGRGIALPHASLPTVREQTVAVIRLSGPLEWGAVDAEPVRLVVLIIAPAGERGEYLHVLAEVARSLNQESVRAHAVAARTAVAAARAIARPPHEGFFMRNRRLIFFIGVVAAVFAGAKLLLPLVNLPADWMPGRPHYAELPEPQRLFQQEMTVTLFIAMVVGTLLFWRFRVAIAAASLGALLVAGVMDLKTTVDFMSIPTILFIMSMMVIVRWLENIGVFRFVVTKALEGVRGVPWLLLLVLMGFSVLLGGFADEVSAILVTFGLAQEVARRTRTPLVPYLMCLVFATNVGSALTLVGNPIGVYIAFKGGLTFEHFLRWATPVSALAAVVTAGLCLLVYRRHFFGRRLEVDLHGIERTLPRIEPARLRTGIITFCTVVLLVAAHSRFERLMHLGEGTALVAVALLVVGFIVFYEQERGRLLVERGIDWWTLLFFMFLFANAACLEYTGVTAKLGYVIRDAAQRLSGAGPTAPGSTGAAAVIMLWFSGLTSGFVDNLPVVAALAPIVTSLKAAQMQHASILWWALLFGGCFGGNLTVIGSTANLVAIGAYEKGSGKSVRFRDWIKVGAVITLVTLAVATAALLLQLRFAPD